MNMLFPPLALLTITATIGVIMGLKVLRGQSNKPVLIGFHFLLGATALETLAVAVHSLNQDPALKPGTAAILPLAVLAIAMLIGIFAAIIGRQQPRTGLYALWVHAGLALTGVSLVALLAARLPA